MSIDHTSYTVLINLQTDLTQCYDIVRRQTRTVVAEFQHLLE